MYMIAYNNCHESYNKFFYFSQKDKRIDIIL